MSTAFFPVDDQIDGLINHYDTWFTGGTAPKGKGGVAGFGRELYPYDKLFSPIQINRLKIKNRLVMAPMGNINMAEETGRPSRQMIEYFVRRARGGVGLITTGLVPVSHGIDPSVTETDKLSYFPRIDRSRTVLSGWRDLAQGVHAEGARIFIQLTAGLGRVGNPQCLLTQFKPPVSASLNPNFYMPQIPSVPLTDRALRKIIKNTGQATADAKACGIDGVYLHGHEGYILEQMTNGAFNRRKLGRYTDPYAFGVEMIREIRDRVGPNYPIMYRIDLSLALNESYGRDTMTNEPALKKFTAGRLPDETLDYMAELVAAGVDIFDVDLGSYDNWWLPHPPASMPAGCFLDVARRAKEYFANAQIRSNAGQEVPIVAVGKLGFPDLAEQALRDGDCDMIMIGRALLADPDWPVKALEGRVDAIRPCIGCQEGCVNEFVEGGHPQCAVNPVSSFEYRGFDTITPTHHPKRIAVVGGGPAGIVTAVLAASRGHTVELFEARDKLCGRLQPGGEALLKFEVKLYREYLIRHVERAKEDDGLVVHMNHEASADELTEFDAVVVAAGGIDLTPPIPGIESAVQAADVLVDPSLLTEGQRCLVIGGGAVGCETAVWLAAERGKSVEVVEMAPHMMEGVCTANRGHLIHAMRTHGVTLHNCAKVTKISPDGVDVEQATTNVPDPYNTWTPLLPVNVKNPLAKTVEGPYVPRHIAGDQVIIAMGGRSNDAIADELRARHGEVHLIGDAFNTGLVWQAVKAAYALGRRI